MWLIGLRRWATNSRDGLSDCYWLWARSEYFTMDSNQLPETSNDTNQPHLALLHQQPEDCRPASGGWAGGLRAAQEMMCGVTMEQLTDAGRQDFPVHVKKMNG